MDFLLLPSHIQIEKDLKLARKGFKMYPNNLTKVLILKVKLCNFSRRDGMVKSFGMNV